MPTASRFNAAKRRHAFGITAKAIAIESLIK
jgi:hypothetical protein